MVIDQKNKELELTNTSSGLQSLTPLLVLLDYICYWIYHNNKPESVQDIKSTGEIFMDLIQGVFGANMQMYDLAVERENILKHGNKDEKGIIEKFEKLKMLRENFVNIHYTNIYLEEPEQNLFPKTQCELVGELIRLINSNEDHSLTISTHSPYILSSVNNLIYGYCVGEKDKLKANEIIPEQNWISYDKVNPYLC